MISNTVQEIVEAMSGDQLLTDGISFNHERIIRRVKSYRLAKYLDRNDDGALFWDLGTSRAHHFAKNIDLDTKDLAPFGTGEASYVQVWILRMKFHKWLGESKYALKLNDLSQGLSDFGSHIQKRVKENGTTLIDSVDLSMIFFDAFTDDFRNTPKVEIHLLTGDEVREKKDVWKNTDELLDRGADTTNNLKFGVPDMYEVWEYWGFYEEKFQQVIGSGTGEDQIILFEKVRKKSDDPYHDYHVGPYQNRWLRRGVYERLFDIQVRANQLVNQNVEVSQIASLLLLRTQNSELMGNVLNDALNGQIVNSEDLQQIKIDNTAMSDFMAELRLIENQADKLAFTPEVITGDELPSGTPFRSVATISSAAKSSFKYIKEYYGENLAFFLNDFIFPSVVKGWKSEDIIEIARDEADLRVYHKQARKVMRWKTFVDNLLEGKSVTLQDLEQVDKVFEEGIDQVSAKIKLPKNFFNFDYHVRTNITGESVNKATRNEALFNSLTLMSQNPALVNTPAFKQYVELNGVNWWRLTPEEVQQIQQGQAISSEPIGTAQDALLASAQSEE